MNKYLKSFLQRGIAFGGFGPVVTGIVLFIIDILGNEVLLNGTDILIMVISTYLLAFAQAGASIFNQIESWSIAKGLGIHFITLYIVYILCYSVNKWIPFQWQIIVIFTFVFALSYLTVWLSVYLITKSTSKRLNKTINSD